MIPTAATPPSPDGTLRYLYTLEKSGMKFGLQNISLLLAGVGNPHQRFPSVHVAGTNGKGSTSSMLGAILTAAGYRTGLYTSPHLMKFSERIRIDGIPVPENRLAEYVRILRPMIGKIHATFFEATTAIAMMYFADEGVDIAVIEVGLGGRLDSTNIITPLLSIITTIDYDHMEYLGNTLTSIAQEKAGIIKTAIPCMTAETRNTVLAVLAKKARQLNAPFFVLRELVDITLTSSGIDGNTFSIDTPLHSYRHLRTELPGIHQIQNAATSILAAEYLSRFFIISEIHIRKGLRETRRLSGLRARLQIVRRRPFIIVDVAHNPQGMRCAVDSMMKFGYRHFNVVFGVMADKDVSTMLEYLKPICGTLIAAQPEISRSLTVKKIILYARALGIQAIPGGTTEKAVSKAFRLSGGNQYPILVIGSHYLAGEVFQKFHS
jgi:dihydrofolate synthase / folylpolyglutamate synthase